MNDPIKIAVDAMGGEDSPNKVISGVEIHHLSSRNTFYLKIIQNKLHFYLYWTEYRFLFRYYKILL